MFLDEVAISVRAGKGGAGCVSFRREAHVPKGGPDGGNGGSGGNIILHADPNKNTLHHFVGRKFFTAPKGKAGQGKLKAGKSGEDLVLHVPVGTLVFEGGKQIIDLAGPGDIYLAARGGLGGKGNAGFKSSTRQTPRFAELGEPGEERDIKLELKLVADVGIIGLPSVGKSTLISVISAARPKIAEYHFTTLTPNLGVVSHRGEDFVVTDLPGLIRGASSGRGLGYKFLRHTERVRFFLHLISADSASPVTDYRTIREELRKFNPALTEKPEIVVLSKTDLLLPEELTKVQAKLNKAVESEISKNKILNHKSEILKVSAPIHQGLTEMLDQTLQTLKKIQPPAPAPKTITTFRPHLEERSHSFTTKRKNKDHYIVDGPRINQIIVMSELGNHEALARVHDILEKFGVVREIIKLGAKPGCKLEIAGKKIEWWG